VFIGRCGRLRHCGAAASRDGADNDRRSAVIRSALLVIALQPSCTKVPFDLCEGFGTHSFGPVILSKRQCVVGRMGYYASQSAKTYTGTNFAICVAESHSQCSAGPFSDISTTNFSWNLTTHFSGFCENYIIQYDSYCLRELRI